MGYHQEIQDMILKCLQETNPQKYINYTLADIDKQPYHEQIWAWWTALAYYKLQSSYLLIEDAPSDAKDGTWITIMGDTRDRYERRKGEWVLVQTITKDEAKSVYGVAPPG